jgi:hypothetical protein
LEVELVMLVLMTFDEIELELDRIDDQLERDS